MMRAVGFVALVGVVAIVGANHVAGQSIVLPNRVNATSSLSNQFDQEQDAFYLGNQPTFNNRLGLEGLVYRDGIEGAGYVRWRVIMRRLDGKPFDRNQSLRLVLEMYESPCSPAVVHDWELQQGDVESHTSFLVPSYAQRNINYGSVNGQVKIYADGHELAGLESHQYFDRQQLKRPGTVALKVASRDRLLEIMDKELSSDTRRILRREEVWYLPSLSIAVDTGLPSDWRELSLAPMIVLDVRSFENLSEPQRQGLAAYVACGSELVFAECMELPMVPSNVMPWLKAIVGRHDITLSPELPWKNRTLPYSVEHGFGRITFIDGSILACQEAETAHSPPFERGTRIDRLFDVDKMEWMIQKIGRPPVWMFLVSIATFTLVAGPGLHWWVHRKLRRPIWLLVVFPTLAAALTLGIFAYAILHEGFKTHARIRSVTCCNASSGLGSVYARQTFFSGFPRSRAEFAPSSEVWEILSSHESRDFQPWDHKSKSTLAIQPEALVCNGILTPRDQRQWIVLRPVEDFKPFDWLADSEGSQVHNRLKDSWSLGMFSDSDGSLKFVEGVQPNQTLQLQPIEPAVAKAMLAKLLPVDQYPEGYSDTPNQSLFDWMDFNRYRYWNTTATRSLDGVQKSARFEAKPATWIANKLGQARHFVLVLDRASHVDQPLGNCIEEDSSHIVIGTW